MNKNKATKGKGTKESSKQTLKQSLGINTENQSGKTKRFETREYVKAMANLDVDVA